MGSQEGESSKSIKKRPPYGKYKFLYIQNLILWSISHVAKKKKKSKEISRQIRFFPQKSACLPNSRSFAKRPSRQIWRCHGHRNDGKMVNRPHRWNNMEIVVSLLQYWLCTAVVLWLFFFFFVNLVSVLLLSWASFFRTHAQHLLTPFW